MSDLIFKPIVSLPIMIGFSVFLLVIILLNRKHIFTRLIIILLLLIISQRPMLQNREEQTYNMNLDIMFVIDLTVSMNAMDVNNDIRMNSVIKDCKYIMDQFIGSNFAVITFANSAQVKMPFTSDAGVIEGIIDNLKVIDPNYAVGSSFDSPYDYMKLLLESSNEREKRQRIVFYISDGEITSSSEKTSNLQKYQDIQNMIDNGAVLGYGTSEGGKIKIIESVKMGKMVDSEGYLINKNNGVAAISKYDENNLKNIASNLSLDYIHMTSSNVIDSKIKDIKEKAIIEESDDTEYSNKDLYYYFSGALLIMLLIELYHYRRNEQ